MQLNSCLFHEAKFEVLFLGSVPASIHDSVSECVGEYVGEYVDQKLFLCLNDQAYYCLIHFYKRSRSTRFWQWFWYPNYPTTCFDLS